MLFTALKDLLVGVKRLGIEFDEVSLDLKMLLGISREWSLWTAAAAMTLRRCPKNMC